MLKKGDRVVTLIAKLGYPAGSHGIIDSLETDCLWVAIYLPGDSIPDDIIRFKYSDIKPE